MKKMIMMMERVIVIVIVIHDRDRDRNCDCDCVGCWKRYFPKTIILSHITKYNTLSIDRRHDTTLLVSCLSSFPSLSDSCRMMPVVSSSSSSLSLATYVDHHQTPWLLLLFALPMGWNGMGWDGGE